MQMICSNCGKMCTEFAGRTSCCRRPGAFVISEMSPMLTKAQIEAIAAKLSANGLAPVTPVYGISDPDTDED